MIVDEAEPPMPLVSSHSRFDASSIAPSTWVSNSIRLIRRPSRARSSYSREQGGRGEPGSRSKLLKLRSRLVDKFGFPSQDIRGALDLFAGLLPALLLDGFSHAWYRLNV